ncbi:MAG: zinc ABC transporter substrate-binding protein [Brevinematales bacterium]|nr:zinc ABC transporter substrate-binding protein [Brevinematales bacterium]
MFFFLGGVVFADPLGVVVSIEPQRYLVESIGKERVRVNVVVPQGKSPHVYEPTPSQLVFLQRARVWFTVGLEFENVLLKRIRTSYPHLRVVDTSEGIKRRCFSQGEILPHEHEGASHDEERVGGVDPHIWMSVRLAEVQARWIRDVLIALDKAGTKTYQKNYEALVKELRELDNEISRRLAPYKGRVFFVYHPVLGYFADDYGLLQMAIEVGGKEPSPRRLQAVIHRAKQEGVKVVFVQEGFSRKSAEAMARAIGGKVEDINPLSSDYPGMFRRIVDVLIEGWQ